jgi:hypothetical protein
MLTLYNASSEAGNVSEGSKTSLRLDRLAVDKDGYVC